MQKQNGMTKDKFKVTGMSCAACQARVEKAASEVEGVSSCTVNLLTNSMTIIYDFEKSTKIKDNILKGERKQSLNLDIHEDIKRINQSKDINCETEKNTAVNKIRKEVIEAVGKAGYGAELMPEEETFEEQEKQLKNTETPKLVKRLVASGILTIVIMYVSMGHVMFGWPMPAFVSGNFPAIGIIEAALALAVIIINKKFFINGFKGAINGGPNMDTLVSLGSGVSFIYSLVILIINADLPEGEAFPDLYFESAAMILTLITVGKLLESIAKGKTTDAIKGLLKLAPQKATVIRNGAETIVNTSEIEIGDSFVVRAGDRIPVDGAVKKGFAKLDESALTGESVLIEKKAGDNVSTATDVFEGEVVCEATRIGNDTVLAQIIKTVKEASASKAPIARIADKVSAVFVPAVIGIAIVTFIVWLLIGAEFSEAITRAVSVLVISCPCALGLATPVAIMVGTGVGSKHGILFKTAESLEMAGKPEIIVLDKTGTITTGKVGEDVVKKDSRDGIEQLKNLGLSVVMLSGDKKDRAEIIASQVGIKNIISGVLPGGKGDAINLLKPLGKVIMVGDGINDAPALKTADIGIAIGAGKDIAIDSADIVVMESRITDVAAVIRLSRRTLLNIKENLFWAFIYNIICIPLAAGVYTGLLGWTLSPMIGALAMALSSFCVCMNALRLNLYNPYKHKKTAPAAFNEIKDAPDLYSETENRIKSTETQKSFENQTDYGIRDNTGLKNLITNKKTVTLKQLESKIRQVLDDYYIKKSDIPVDVDLARENTSNSKADEFGALKSRPEDKNNGYVELEKQGDSEKEKLMEKTLKIEGMMCPHCSGRVKDALEKIDGVSEAFVSHETGLAEIKMTKEIDESVLVKTVEDAGYKVI